MCQAQKCSRKKSDKHFSLCSHSRTSPVLLPVFSFHSLGVRWLDYPRRRKSQKVFPHFARNALPSLSSSSPPLFPVPIQTFSSSSSLFSSRKIPLLSPPIRTQHYLLFSQTRIFLQSSNRTCRRRIGLVLLSARLAYRNILPGLVFRWSLPFSVPSLHLKSKQLTPTLVNKRWENINCSLRWCATSAGTWEKSEYHRRGYKPSPEKDGNDDVLDWRRGRTTNSTKLKHSIFPSSSNPFSNAKAIHLNVSFLLWGNKWKEGRDSHTHNTGFLLARQDFPLKDICPIPGIYRMYFFPTPLALTYITPIAVIYALLGYIASVSAYVTVLPVLCMPSFFLSCLLCWKHEYLHVIQHTSPLFLESSLKTKSLWQSVVGWLSVTFLPALFFLPLAFEYMSLFICSFLFLLILAVDPSYYSSLCLAWHNLRVHSSLCQVPEMTRWRD